MPSCMLDLVYLCNISGQHGIFCLRVVAMSNCAPTSQVIELIRTFREMMYLAKCTHVSSFCTITYEGHEGPKLKIRLDMKAVKYKDDEKSTS